MSAPFAGFSKILVIVPSQFDHLPESERHSLQHIAPLLKEEADAIARELGAPLEILENDSDDATPNAARWLIGLRSCNPALLEHTPITDDAPTLYLNRVEGLLITDALSAAGIWDTFSLLRSLSRVEDGKLTVADCASVEDACAFIEAEVGDSYPSFGLRGLDWDAICSEHRPRVRAAEDPLAAMQTWLAALHDGHTWVRPVPPYGDLPYQVWATEAAAILTHVPEGSRAYEVGVRRGDTLLEVDHVGWWKRTAATPHSRPLVTGRRILQAPVGTDRFFAAQAPDGTIREWSEIVPERIYQKTIEYHWMPSGAGYLKINAWLGMDLLDEAFEIFQRTDRLIVDVRGNQGGDLVFAQGFRDRFLREDGVIGSIRYSLGHNILSDPDPIYGEPHPKPWRGRVRFLTDPLTYSASEDAILGLQGLPHVKVLGEASGGGSGRLRVLRLFEGWRLTISTALTYDRNGHCVEGAGIPVDHVIQPHRFDPSAPDVVLMFADEGW